MNVFSAFDGISCARYTLEKAGVKVDNYFASEIDKFPIAITQHNYPDTVQLGDIRNIAARDLPKIDFMFGGWPCQGHSIAGKRAGLKDTRSGLFWELVRLKNELQPKYFLFENVTKIKPDELEIINKELGVEPVRINSSLVSAQNRERYYWCNWAVEQPRDRGITLNHILETRYDVKTGKRGQYKKFQDKGGSLCGGANSGGNHSDMDIVGVEKSKCIRVGGKGSPHNSKQNWDSYPVVGCRIVGEVTDIKGHDILKRVYDTYAKSPTITTLTGGNQFVKIAIDNYYWRRYTPIECERLQTLPDNYTQFGNFDGVVKPMSNTQRYKALGNGWTVEVIAHMLKQANICQKSEVA